MREESNAVAGSKSQKVAQAMKSLEDTVCNFEALSDGICGQDGKPPIETFTYPEHPAGMLEALPEQIAMLRDRIDVTKAMLEKSFL